MTAQSPHTAVPGDPMMFDQYGNPVPWRPDPNATPNGHYTIEVTTKAPHQPSPRD